MLSFHGRGVGSHRFPARDIAAALSLTPIHPICHADLGTVIQAVRPATHYRWHKATSIKSKTAPNRAVLKYFDGIIIARSKSKKCLDFFQFHIAFKAVTPKSATANFLIALFFIS